jgi:hypothetical protein
MQHITGIPRYQILFSSLVEAISLDNQIRFIDAFVENKEHIVMINKLQRGWLNYFRGRVFKESYEVLTASCATTCAIASGRTVSFIA